MSVVLIVLVAAIFLVIVAGLLNSRDTEKEIQIHFWKSQASLPLTRALGTALMIISCLVLLYKPFGEAGGEDQRATYGPVIIGLIGLVMLLFTDRLRALNNAYWQSRYANIGFRLGTFFVVALVIAAFAFLMSRGK